MAQDARVVDEIAPGDHGYLEQNACATSHARPNPTGIDQPNRAGHLARNFAVRELSRSKGTPNSFVTLAALARQIPIMKTLQEALRDGWRYAGRVDATFVHVVRQEGASWIGALALDPLKDPFRIGVPA
jgi:hypothetical protein